MSSPPPVPPPLPATFPTVVPSAAPTPEQLRQWADAESAARAIRRAVGVARFDGWSIALFAALSLICGLSGVVGVAMGLAMGVIAYVELSNVKRLRAFDAAAARTLGFNQLAFAALLTLYALVNLYLEATGRGGSTRAISDAVRQAAGQDPQVANVVGSIEDLARQLTMLVYAALIPVALFAQGFTALFYFRRVGMIRRYLEQTPAWIVQMQRAAAAQR